MIQRIETTAPDGTVTVEEIEVDDPEPTPLDEAIAAVDAAGSFAELKSATVAYLTLLTPGGNPT